MFIRTPRILASICVLGLGPQVVTEARAQTAQWRQIAQTIQPHGSASHCMAYDSGRDRVVMFQTVTSGFPTETWEWDGAAWARVSTAGPGERSAAGMCYDSARQRTVLFGGSPSASGETWEWDGASWSLVGTSGPGRYFHGMAYDPVRQRTVIHGGFRPGVGRLADTWEWDGSTWTQVATTGPGPRQQHVMTFDPARGRVVLFGGYGAANSAKGDLWEWDGSAWTLVNDAGPLATDSALVSDSTRQRLVLLSGWPSPGRTWEWDGTAWTQLADSGPPSRARHAMAFDEARGETVLFGGAATVGFGSALDDTWAWNGTAWARKNIGPAARAPSAMTFDPDRERTLMVSPWFGSAPSETWEWDGSGWNFAASGPPSRQSAGIAYDTARRRAIFFGGNVYASVDYFFYGDTWIWEGGVWTQLDAPGPAARAGHAMAYDSGRDRVVLFGGWSNEEDILSETWEWDGAAWALATSSGPEGREGASMVYDHGRQRIVLFGGRSNTRFATWLNDTWEWDGVSWVRIAISEPPARAYASMQYDNVGDRILLFGGESGNQPTFNDTWELSGSIWSQLSTPAPHVRAHAGSAFDSSRRQMVLFGGVAQNGQSADTWEFGVDCPADFNEDGGIDGADVTAFFDAWSQSESGADVNADGGVDGADVETFFRAWENGGC